MTKPVAEIDAIVMDGDADDAELWEIEENLNREELTPTQAAIAHRRREEILVAKGLVQTVGANQHSRASDKLSKASYSRQAAGTLGVDERTVRRDLARGKKVAPDILAEIEGTSVDKGVVLDRLAAATCDNCGVAAHCQGEADPADCRETRPAGGRGFPPGAGARQQPPWSAPADFFFGRTISEPVVGSHGRATAHDGRRAARAGDAPARPPHRSSASARGRCAIQVALRGGCRKNSSNPFIFRRAPA